MRTALLRPLLVVALLATPAAAQSEWDEEPPGPDYRRWKTYQQTYCTIGDVYVFADGRSRQGIAGCLDADINVYTKRLGPDGEVPNGWSYLLQAGFSFAPKAPAFWSRVDVIGVAVGRFGEGESETGLYCGGMDGMACQAEWSVLESPWDVRYSFASVRFAKSFGYWADVAPGAPGSNCPQFGADGTENECGFDADNFRVTSVTTQLSAVPEPSTWALLGTGLLGLAAVARFRRTA